jgi:hypothetical protein
MHADGQMDQRARPVESSEELLAKDFDPRLSPRERTYRRRRLVTGALALLVVAGAVVGIILGTSSGGPGSPKSPAKQSAAVLRTEAKLATATNSVTTSGTVVTNGFAQLPGVPTTAAVAGVIGPYLTALQQYRAVLAHVSLPDPTAASAHAVSAEVRTLITYLESLPGVTSLHLGSWINGFNLHAAELQSAVDVLQANLS